jgi:hypothetical protein
MNVLWLVQDGLKLNSTHQLLVYPDYINPFTRNDL